MSIKSLLYDLSCIFSHPHYDKVVGGGAMIESVFSLSGHGPTRKEEFRFCTTDPLIKRTFTFPA